VVALGLSGCAPLPGGTLDPLAPTFGSDQGGPPPARDQWVGRYEDSRGAGEIAMQLRRVGDRVEGIWQLRTGGDGVLSGTLVGATSIIKFQLASQGGTCFVLLEGAGEIKGNAWTSTYSGRDCQGPISNGRLTLTRR
jgi:hypothetical protein